MRGPIAPTASGAIQDSPPGMVSLVRTYQTPGKVVGIVPL